jgi:hypothetical protein
MKAVYEHRAARAKWREGKKRRAEEVKHSDFRAAKLI